MIKKNPKISNYFLGITVLYLLFPCFARGNVNLGYWKFKKDKVLLNALFQKRRGIIVGAKWKKGRGEGDGLFFDGRMDYVDIEIDRPLTFKNSFYADIWFRPENDNSHIISCFESSGNGFALTLVKGKPVFWLPGGKFKYIKGKESLKKKEWHHIAVEYQKGKVKLYLNGKLSGEGIRKGSVVIGTKTLRIGAMNKNIFLGSYIGSIDEIYISDKPYLEGTKDIRKVIKQKTKKIKTVSLKNPSITKIPKVKKEEIKKPETVPEKKIPHKKLETSIPEKKVKITKKKAETQKTPPLPPKVEKVKKRKKKKVKTPEKKTPEPKKIHEIPKKEKKVKITKTKTKTQKKVARKKAETQKTPPPPPKIKKVKIPEVKTKEVPPPKKIETVEEFNPPPPIRKESGIEGMLLISGGSFIMGSWQYPDEMPQRIVYVDDFLIGEYPVTQKEYMKFVKTNSYKKPKDIKDCLLPAVNISWYDAYAYAKWLGRRLPTEAEWEKAARGTDGRIWPWGNSYKNANVALNIKKITPVGKFPDTVSPFGCHDMAGNAWEWVADWYDSKYYKRGQNRNPKGGGATGLKVLRGGNFYGPYGLARTSYRHKKKPTITSGGIGFRVAISP